MRIIRDTGLAGAHALRDRAELFLDEKAAAIRRFARRNDFIAERFEIVRECAQARSGLPAPLSDAARLALDGFDALMQALQDAGLASHRALDFRCDSLHCAVCMFLRALMGFEQAGQRQQRLIDPLAILIRGGGLVAVPADRDLEPTVCNGKPGIGDDVAREPVAHGETFPARRCSGLLARLQWNIPDAPGGRRCLLHVAAPSRGDCGRPSAASANAAAPQSRPLLFASFG